LFSKKSWPGYFKANSLSLKHEFKNGLDPRELGLPPFSTSTLLFFVSPTNPAKVPSAVGKTMGENGKSLPLFP
jgi:hypothetical protein